MCRKKEFAGYGGSHLQTSLLKPLASEMADGNFGGQLMQSTIRGPSAFFK
jgi:hypothetical protein